jgi:hypothetical protein
MSWIQRIRVLVLVASCALGADRHARASYQSDQTGFAAISGSATTVDGTRLPAVRIQIEGLAGSYEVTTQVNGWYAIELLPPGHYRLTASLDGFDPQIQERRIGLGGAIFVHFVMTPAGDSSAVLAEWLV